MLNPQITPHPAQAWPHRDAAGEQHLADMAKLREAVRTRQPHYRAVPQPRQGMRPPPALWGIVLGLLLTLRWVQKRA